MRSVPLSRSGTVIIIIIVIMSYIVYILYIIDNTMAILKVSFEFKLSQFTQYESKDWRFLPVTGIGGATSPSWHIC